MKEQMEKLEEIKKVHPTLDNIHKWVKIFFYCIALFGIIALMFMVEPFYSVIVVSTPLFALGGFIFGIIALDRY